MNKKQQLQYIESIKTTGFIGKSEGLSMMPFIQPGSDVHIKPVPFSRLNEGDIVTFQKEDTLISHRILYKSKRYIVRFDEPQRAISPGQSAVFYTKKGEMLGGGRIV